MATISDIGGQAMGNITEYIHAIFLYSFIKRPIQLLAHSTPIAKNLAVPDKPERHHRGRCGRRRVQERRARDISRALSQ